MLRAFLRAKRALLNAAPWTECKPVQVVGRQAGFVQNSGTITARMVLPPVAAGAGRDLRGLSAYRKGRQRLMRLSAHTGPPLALMPATRELAGAQTWMRDYVDAGVEGVVVKHREHSYRPRRRSWLAPHEVPREIVFVDDLPRTTTGKIMRRALRIT